MSSSTGDAEIRAIEQVIAALDPLDSEARSRVLDYSFKRLGISGEEVRAEEPRREESSESHSMLKDSPAADIRSLREEKQPKSANEMAAVVGYYLADLAPESERKTEIGTADVKKYFKQAQHPLPEAPDKTLRNAAAAGYFDSVDRGLYRLNPVGHNLVAHSLPRASSPEVTRRKKPKKSAKASGKSKAKTKSSSKRKAKRKAKK